MKTRDIKRKGYNDYFPGLDWKDVCPFKNYLDMSLYHEGWEEAADEDKIESERIQKRKEFFLSCPWYGLKGECRATKEVCDEDNCAVLYLTRR